MSAEVAEVSCQCVDALDLDLDGHVRSNEKGRISFVGNPAFVREIVSRQFSQRTLNVHPPKGDQKGAKMDHEMNTTNRAKRLRPPITSVTPPGTMTSGACL